MEIKTLLSQGYVISPYYSKEDVESFEEVKTVELDEEKLRSIIVDTSENLLYDNEKLVLIKYLSKYYIKPLDLVEKIENELKNKDKLDYEKFQSWITFLNLKDDNSYVFLPHLDEKYYKHDKNGLDDYLFDKDEHIVSFIVRLIKNELSEDNLEDNLNIYINFIKEVISQRNILANRRTYSKDTLSLIVHSLCYESYCGRKFNEEVLLFYKENLLKCAKQEDNRSMRTIGYEYYEGTNGFPCDPYESCYWLEKYYKATEDPDVARTLGYIYYYGRTTDGIPQGDKAFQYFAIGHIAGGYFEATYKLADCYVKGYGTPINHQCAYNLVEGIYDITYNHFLKGDDSKFADVALRLGTYYKDGIYVKKNIIESQLYYLEAKVAIKKRLENTEYIGDRGVAVGISKSLDEVQNQKGLQPRIVKNGGYLLTNPLFIYDDNEYEIKFTGEYIHVIVKPNKKDGNKYIINCISQIGFAERSERVEFLIKPSEESLDNVKGFVDSLNENKIIKLGFVADKIFAILEIENDEMPAFTTFDELILIPQTIQDISKQYTIVSIEFYPGSKLYDYLSLKEDVKIEDKVKVKIKGETKLSTVKAIKLVYEDELPLPYKKMGTVS